LPICIYCGESFTPRHNPTRTICYNPECKKRQLQLINKRYYEKNKEHYHKYSKEYWRNNYDIIKKKIRNYRINLRHEVFQHYSPELKCQCCGESHFEFLTLDHIHGNGHLEQKEHKKDMILWVKQHNYPEGYQVLCMNCNFSKRTYDKQFCPVHHPELYAS
jgi:hypothetical protein